MTFTDLNTDQLGQFKQMDIEGPFQMINLLKFKKEDKEKGISGAQQYELYMQAALPFFLNSGARVIYNGTLATNLIGPSIIEWDKVLIIEYDNKASFLTMITTPGYPADQRAQALEDSRLIFSQSNKR